MKYNLEELHVIELALRIAIQATTHPMDRELMYRVSEKTNALIESAEYEYDNPPK